MRLCYVCLRDIVLFALLTLVLNEVTAAKLEKELKQRLQINNDDYIERARQGNELPPSVREIVGDAKEYNESERRALGLAVRWGDSDAADDANSDNDTFNAMTYTPAMRPYTATNSQLSDVAQPPDDLRKSDPREEERIQKMKKLKKFLDHNIDLLEDVVDINKLDELTGSSLPSRAHLSETTTYNPMPTAEKMVHLKKDVGDLIGNAIKSGIKRQIKDLLAKDPKTLDPNLRINRHVNAPAQPFEVSSYKDPYKSYNPTQFSPPSPSPGDMDYADPLMYTKGRLLIDEGQFFGVKAGQKYAARIRDVHEARDKLPRERLKSTTRDPRDFDLAPAMGGRVSALRSKGRICQRNVLIPEGPKYDSKGMVYLKAFQPKSGSNMDYARTVKPDFLLPKCCNCCKKSVLGCE